MKPELLHGHDLPRYYTPRDAIEAHILNELRDALAQLADAENLSEKDNLQLTEQLETLRNVLCDVGLPADPDDLYTAVRSPDALSTLLAKAMTA